MRLADDNDTMVNALALAELCAVADREPFTWPAWICDAQPFAVAGGGFAARDGRSLVLVFRKTETLSDVAIDAEVAMRPLPSGIGYAHAGFLQTVSERLTAYTAALGQVLSRMPSHTEPDRLYVTGHSLGGALATLVGHALYKVYADMRPVVYSFGSPRVFDAYGAALFDTDADSYAGPLHWRFTDIRDPVPKIPLFGPAPAPRPFVAVLHEYRHCGKEVQLPVGWAGKLAAHCGLIPRLVRRLWMEWEETLAVDLHQHRIDRYLANLAPTGAQP